MRRRVTPFIDQIRKIANDDDYLNKEHRDYLRELAKYPNTEDVWTAIEKKCGPRSLLLMRFFIRDLARSRVMADDVDQWPDERAILHEIERFSSYLESLQGVVLLRPDGIDPAVFYLKELAANVRKRLESSVVSRRRQDVAGSKKRIHFMQLMSGQMKEFFGHPFDNGVAELTNIYFPDAVATTDSVRAARRPSQRRQRQKMAA
jgi:hypothetical protein